MPRKYKHLRYEDRRKLEEMFKAGASVALAAGKLGVHRDTVYKELARCGADPHTYKAAEAQETL